MNIKILSEATINQIAAGEVVEDPASAVKELVENAIDAGATRIEVDITGGGYLFLCVMDNGSGMRREDALLSLERHATSKISTASDLFSLKTMGFRGEALSSIAAISKMRLVTAEEGSIGTAVQVEGGVIVQVSPLARTTGTTIEVNSLFYNTPARKKFQKKAPASQAEITKLIASFALGYPEIYFSLTQGGERLSLFPQILHASFEEQLRLRIDQVLGRDYFSSPPYQMENRGWASHPLQTRINRSGQYLFINRRLVISPLVSRAIKDGYGTRIAADRYPLFVLHLHVPEDQIDVNVHPQKREVRFAEEGVIYEELHLLVQTSLGEKKVPFTNYSFPSLSVTSDLSPYLIFSQEKEVVKSPVVIEPQAIGVFGHFLFLDEGELLRIVDLHKAVARILFDRQKKEGALESHYLLIPISLYFTQAEAAWLLSHIEELLKLGFMIRPLGEKSFILEAIPIPLTQDEAKSSLEEIVHQGEVSMPLGDLALCFGRKKSSFGVQEALLIFKQLQQTTCPNLCPKGNPTMQELRRDEISLLFKKN